MDRRRSYGGSAPAEQASSSSPRSPSETLPWWTYATLPFATAAAGRNREKTIGHVYVRVVEATGLCGYETRGGLFSFSLGRDRAP